MAGMPFCTAVLESSPRWEREAVHVLTVSSCAARWKLKIRFSSDLLLDLAQFKVTVLHVMYYFEHLHAENRKIITEMKLFFDVATLHGMWKIF